VSRNPYLVILFGSLSGAMVICAVLFWIILRHADVIYAKLDADAAEDTLRESDVDDSGLAPPA
jgi:hypothetical protein